MNFLLRKDLRKFLKRKDSDVGERGDLRLSLNPCPWVFVVFRLLGSLRTHILEEFVLIKFTHFDGMGFWLEMLHFLLIDR